MFRIMIHHSKNCCIVLNRRKSYENAMPLMWLKKFHSQDGILTKLGLRSSLYHVHF